MIWDPDAASDRSDSAIVSHISAEIKAVCGDDLAENQANVKELARAVEVFLEKEHDSPLVDSKYLVMLASRALSSIGEGDVARRLLVFGTGLVRPSVWEVSGGKAMWILDLKQMTVKDDSSLELFFFGCLNIVLDSIADIWDETKGEGTLGLQNVCPAAAGLLGKVGKKKEVWALAGEIRALCSKKLDQIRAARGWQAAPEVINLDI